MKTIWLRRLFFLISCSIFFNASVSAQNQTLTLAYLEYGLSDLKDSEMQIALQLLAKELTRDSDVNMSIQAVLTLPEFLALIKSGKVNYALRGQQILNMFHIQSLVKTSVNQLDYMVDMYNEYKSLKSSNQQ